MNLPKTAIDFVLFMEDIWRMDCRPAEDGGIIIGGHPHYNILHDALQTARQCGAGRTGGSKVNNEDCQVYRFPDGSGVLIGTNGSWVKLARNRYQPRPRESQP